MGVPVTSTGGASTRGGGNAGGALQGGVVKPLRGGVYDAEFSISQSFAEEVIPEVGTMGTPVPWGPCMSLGGI